MEVRKILGRFWTKEEVKLLKEMYERGDSCEEIAEAVHHGAKGIYTKAMAMGFDRKVFSKHDRRMTAIYKDKDWCYDRYIVQHKSYDEMAAEANCSKRVIEKWCGDVYGYNLHTYRHFAKLNPLEKEIVMAGRLGDGHITRGDKPLYVEVHADDQKEYLYWKYEQLKTIQTSPPKLTPGSVKFFNGKSYNCQNSYRLSTAVLDELGEIRDMPKIEIIDNLTELGVALYFLDDASRSYSNWILCTGVLTDDEVERLITVLHDKFEITMWRNKDKRYATVDAPSSITIDDFILENLPNDLDIVQHKIYKKSKQDEAV